jgi:hypothetical protein
LKHSDRSNFYITALVRSTEKGEKLKSQGVDATVLGSYTDENLGFLTEATSQADVVFATVRLDLHFFPLSQNLAYLTDAIKSFS